MGALSVALPLSTFLYLLPLMTNIHEKATSVTEQLNNLIDISVPKEIQRDDGEITLEFLGGSLSPSEVTKSTVPVKDSTKLNVGFQAKAEPKKLPLSPHNRRGISANVQFANQAKCSQGVASNENKASKEFSSEEEWAKSPTKAVEDAKTIEESRKNMTVFRLYVPDIKDALREKFAKASMQLGLDVGVTSKKDTDGGNTDKTDRSVVDNHARRKKNYVRLCKRITDGSTTSLMQKLRKECVKLPRSEFYLEQGTRNVNKDDTIRLVGKTAQEKENESNENKQRDGMVADVIETPISDISANYDESDVKVIDKFGMGLNIKTPVIAKLLRNDKISLSTSTTR
ncbi:hypothetical protein P5V15_001531 [Pogonomyrmex californicus]